MARPVLSTSRAQAALLGAALLAGCTPEVRDGQFACGTAADCPPGFSCGDDGRCRRGSPPPALDASTDAAPDARSDARTDAASDAGVCRTDAGVFEPDGGPALEPCLACDPSTGRLVDVCESEVDTSHADFLAGRPSDPSELYATASGAVLPIQALDLDADGLLDIVATRYGGVTGALARSSPIFFGPFGSMAPRTVSLPINGALHAATADLDDDGYVDVVIAAYQSVLAGTDGASKVFWGTATGPDPATPTTLMNTGMHGVVIVDADRDGRLDLVFGSHSGVDSSQAMPLYLNDGARFTSAVPTYVGQPGATMVAAADLDRDGLVDLVAAGYSRWQGGAPVSDVPSRILWGTSAAPFFEVGLETFETRAARDVTIADLNGDGHLDLVFTQAGGSANAIAYYGDGTRTWDSSAMGRSRTFAATSTEAVSVGDFDGHVGLDVVLGGPAVRIFRSQDALASPTTIARAAFGLVAADFTGDPAGLVDLFVAERGTGGVELYDYASLTSPPVFTTGATDLADSVVRDPGSVFDRREAYTFDSRVLDAARSVEWVDLEAGAIIPRGADRDLGAIRVTLRSGATEDALRGAPFVGPDGSPETWYDPGAPRRIAAMHAGHRFLQYRATFRRVRPVYGPILQGVRVRHRAR